MGSEIPKQYMDLCGSAIVTHTIGNLMSHPRIDGVIAGISPDDAHWRQFENSGLVAVTPAGAERADTVLNGLNYLSKQETGNNWVMVHDAVRPLVRANDIDRLIAASIKAKDGGLLAMPVADTIKQSDQQGRSAQTLDRNRLWRAATPQMFPLWLLRDSLWAALEAGIDITDEASAMEWAGYRPALVPCAEDNIKITTPQDLEYASWVLGQREHAK